MTTLLMLLFSPLAVAYPDEVVADLDTVSGVPSRMVADEDGRIAAALGGSTPYILDGWTWQASPITGVCDTANDVVLWSDDGGDTATLWVACEDGTVVPVALDGARTATIGDPITVSDGAAIGAAAGTYDGVDTLWVVSQGDTNLEVHSVTLSTSAVDDGDAFPSTLAQSSYSDVDVSNGYVIVVHGADDISRVDLATGGASLTVENLPGRDFVAAEVDSLGNAFIVDADGAILSYNIGSNDFAIILDDEDGLQSVGALAFDEGAQIPFAAIYESTQQSLLFYEFTNNAISDRLSADVSLVGIESMVVMGDYLLTGAEDGLIQVLTEAPWVTVTDAPSDTLSAGDDFEISFEVDTAGDWSVHVGDPTGDALAEGSISAGESATAAVTVTDAFGEGANRVYVVLDAAGDTDGGAAADVDVDNPPSKVSLQEADVGFGDEKIYLDFSGVSDEDLLRYEVYLSTVEYVSDDYATGGPEYEGDDDWSNPSLLTEVSAGEVVSVTIEPVTNGVTYYVAVRAVDTGELEGPMSNVVTVVPQDTLNAAELAGELGGCQGCAGAGGGLGGLLLGGLAGAFAAARRRRGFAALPLVGLASALALPGAAQAAEERPKKHSDLELRVGPTTMVDPSGALSAVYASDRFTTVWLEGGPQLWRVLEFDVGVGVIRKEGNPVGELSGTTSTESSRISLLPLSFSVTGRLELIREQWIVPFARVGGDYWAWMEQTDEGEGFFLGDRLTGGKPGVHWGYGVDILLDPLDRARASQAEALWGIHDTYIVIEWTEHMMLEDNTGLDFGGTALSFGVKVDR